MLSDGSGNEGMILRGPPTTRTQVVAATSRHPDESVVGRKRRVGTLRNSRGTAETLPGGFPLTGSLGWADGQGEGFACHAALGSVPLLQL